MLRSSAPKPIAVLRHQRSGGGSPRFDEYRDGRAGLPVSYSVIKRDDPQRHAALQRIGVSLTDLMLAIEHAEGTLTLNRSLAVRLLKNHCP